ncbi:MAG: BACON domain-containing protein [Prevotella sp.]|nr:BACON domain-containing protein [Prevotella sp.]
MKECPLCHSQYDENVSFCVKDGNRLVEVITEKSNKDTLEKENSEKHSSNPKSKGCFKKIMISIVVVIVAFVALYNYLMNAATYLRLEPDTIASGKVGGECKIDVDYDGYVWVINHKPDWVEVEESENHFDIIVSPNTDGQYREGCITVQSGKLVVQTIIKQLGVATKLSLSKTNLNFDKYGGTEFLSIETDGCKWSTSSPEWLSVSSDNDAVRIKCAKNNGQYRTGRIIFSEDNISTSIFVTQGGECNNCGGDGEVQCTSCFGMGGSGFGMFYTQCFFCGGAGKFKCNVCNGSGERE